MILKKYFQDSDVVSITMVVRRRSVTNKYIVALAAALHRIQMIASSRNGKSFLHIINIHCIGS